MAAALETLLQDWRERLRAWSVEGSLASAARHALELEGEQPLLDELVAQWAAGNFSSIPPITLLPASSMPGAAGAYAISTGTIYLNKDWLETASDERAIAVLTEELGHHLDGLLNEADTTGDEGEVFARNLIGIELGSLETKLPDNKQIHAAGKDKALAVEASSLEWYSAAYQLSDLAWGDVDFNEEADLLTVSLWERQWSGWSSGSWPLNSDIEVKVSLENLNSIYIPYDLADTALTFYGSSSAPTDDELWWSDNNTDSSSLIVDIDSYQSYGDVKWEVARVSTYNNQAFDDWEIEEIDNYILDSKNNERWDYQYPESLPVLATPSSLDVSGITWSTVDHDDYNPRYPFYELGKGDLLYLSPTASGSSYGGYGSAFGSYPVLRVAAQQTGGEEAQVLVKDIGSVYFDGGYGGPSGPAWVAPPSDPDLHPDHDSGISDSDNLTNDSSPRFTGTHEESGFTIELFANGASLGTAISEYGSYPADWSLSVEPSAELADGTYSIIAKATDLGGNTSSYSSTLLITIDTLAPVFSSTATAITIDENSGTNQVIYTALAADDSSVSYSLKTENNNDASSFYIDKATGEVTLTADPDHESQSSYTFTVVATDAAGNSSEKSVTLAINDLDDTAPAAPSTPDLITASDTGSSDSDNITSDTTPTFTGTAEPGSTINLLMDGVLYPANTAVTTADPVTGEWSYTIPAEHAATEDITSSLTVTATDGAGNTSEPSDPLIITIDLTPPVFVSGSFAAAVDKNSGAGQLVYAAQATDTHAVQYALKTNNDDDVDLFAIDASTGDVTLAIDPDYETQASYAFTVIATDAAGNSTEQAVTLAVNDLDDTPPAPPSTPDLSPDSDTGISDSDDLTADNTPSFSGTAEPGSAVELLADDSSLGSTTANNNGNWLFTVPDASALPDGSTGITAVASMGSTTPGTPTLQRTAIAPARPGRTHQEVRNSYAFAVLKNDGSVVTWGDSRYGGDSSSVASQLQSGVTQIFSTGVAFAALKDDGSVITWGDSSRGGDSSSVASQLQSGVTQIFSNGSAFAALRDDGSVITWGVSSIGGDSSSVAAQLQSGVTQIISSYGAFAALKDNGSVVTWGDSDWGGDSSSVADKLQSGVTQIFSTGIAFAALKDNGSVVTWGSSDWGGNSSSVAGQLQGGVTQIISSYGAFAALKDNGSVVTWGSSDWGGNSSSVAGQLQGGVSQIFRAA